MSKYLLDKFLFTVDRDPDLVERYREDPGATVAWWEAGQANLILNCHDGERSTWLSFTGPERDALAAHDYVALFELGAHNNARAHNSGDLRDVQAAPYQRVVVKDAGSSVLAGEDAILQRQIDAGGIDQVDDRHAITHGDLLGTKNFRNGFRPPGACFHGGVIRHDHGRASFDVGEPSDNPRGGGLSVVPIVGNEQPDLQKHRVRIDQSLNALTRGQFTFVVLFFYFAGAAAFAKFFLQLTDFPGETPHVTRETLHVFRF